ncbi:hypothetical protein EHS13_31710 [Paenibacillus psychroresistens]|uniref:Uncharacterized protein n=1 Tax=Paenibacillus psychroresistens TaxID=1778678 RepID=A0A6B8RRV5_9BACL|nr:hypothetical protein [Paenibacillus psychroresistens]QGQ99120.1 hypothetical protein EHS13_31710 [Paenibacillus psychroresistens]
MKPNVSALGNWLASWLQEDGAIHGFHNHSVWGSNPYRWADFTSGHSTWASPLMAAFCRIAAEQGDPRLKDQVLQMIQFQTSRFQEDGQYKHIGFQVGEMLNQGLIHNMMPNVALGLTAINGRSWLPAEALESIRKAMLRNLNACDVIYPFKETRNISNQEYCRLWGKLLFQAAFPDSPWSGDIQNNLNFMIEHYHISGIPDQDCEATYRYLGDATIIEPAEYYGLMIAPLVLAYEMFGDPKYLQHAGALCRHVVRCAWNDHRGQKRFHRMWLLAGAEWRKMNGPMLIAGMGMSLYGIECYLAHSEDEEMARFLEECDETYAFYQTPRGYFASATGWQNEADVAPSSAWHTHDLYYLLHRHGLDENMAEGLEKPNRRMSVLLGDQCMWVEDDEHWAINDYYWQDVYKLIGRKDEVTFGRDTGWVGGERKLPEHFLFPTQPVFVKTDEGIYLKADSIVASNMDVSSIATVPYLGLWE